MFRRTCIKLIALLSLAGPCALDAGAASDSQSRQSPTHIETLPALNIPRSNHVMMDLDGELTVIGGHTTGFVPTATAEYLSGGKWHVVESIYPHDYALAVRLRSGDVLVAGGMSEPFGKGHSLGSELYHPATHSFSPLPILDMARSLASATLLSDGTIVVSGNWYGSDCIATYSQDGGGKRLKTASQPRAIPYILPSSPGNALILSGSDTYGQPLDTLVIDRLRGESFTDSLFASWRPYRWESNLVSQRFFIGNTALGVYASLFPVRRIDDGQIAIAKQVGEQFSLLETDAPIPMKNAQKDSIAWGHFQTDAANSQAYIVGLDATKQLLYVCLIDYEDALHQGKARTTLLTANNPGRCEEFYFTLLPGGRLAFAGGNTGDNYNPIADAFIFHTRAFRQGRTAAPWLYVLLAAVICAVALGLVLGRKPSRIPSEPPFPEPEPSGGADLSSRIAAMMEEKQLYLHKGLKVQDVATQLGTNSTYISACINGQWGMTFPEYLGSLRIRHAQQLMLSSPEKPLYQIADEAGFSSEQSFYRSFKAVTGKTPSEWVEAQEELEIEK